MSLLQRLKSGFAASNEQAGDPEHDLQIAAAVLLLEMEHADHEHSPEERAEIAAQLKAYFDLNGDECTTLIDAAEKRAGDAVSLHRFLQVLNQHLDLSQKRRVVEMLWRVAYADENLDAEEEGLLRHIADLLGLPHREYIQAKLAVTGQD